RQDRAGLFRRFAGPDPGRSLATGGGGGAAVRRADRRVHGDCAQTSTSWRDVWDDQAMIAALDKFSLICMALGAAMMLQPWWSNGFRAGFFVTICATILQIIVSHLPVTS